MKKREFITTDTHGEREKLEQLLKMANFDFENDKLIHNGDVVDRGPDSFGVVELLLKIENRVCIRGNHDQWFLQWLLTGRHPAPSYFSEARESYMIGTESTDKYNIKIPHTHIQFFVNQRNWYLDEQNRFFCHAGFDPNQSIYDQTDDTFYWDRNLFNKVASLSKNYRIPMVNDFKRVFIGHTPTINYGTGEPIPIYGAQVVNLDTGGVFGGRHTLIDITDDENHIIYQV